jgi:hypothetical protein
MSGRKISSAEMSKHTVVSARNGRPGTARTYARHRNEVPKISMAAKIWSDHPTVRPEYLYPMYCSDATVGWGSHPTSVNTFPQCGGWNWQHAA